MDAFSKSRWAGRRDGLVEVLRSRLGDSFQNYLSPEERKTISVLNELVNTVSEGPDSAEEYNNGRREAYYFATLPREKSLGLLFAHDYTPDSPLLPEEQEAINRKLRKRRNIVFTVIGIVVAAIIAWNLPVTQEYFAYRNVAKTRSVWDYGQYLNDYPDGSHRAEAERLMEENLYNLAMGRAYPGSESFGATEDFDNYIKYFGDSPRADDVRWRNVEKWKNNSKTLYLDGSYYDGENLLEALDSYIADSPSGKHIAEASEMKKHILDLNYDRLASHSDFGKGVKGGEEFARKLFDYMNSRGLREVNMEFETVNELKDYSDLTESEQKLMKIIYDIDRKISPIKSSFPEYSVSNIADGAKLGFAKALTCDSVKSLLTVTSSEEAASDVPVVSVKMTIRDLCDPVFKIPEVFVYYTSRSVPRSIDDSLKPGDELVFAPEVIFETSILLPATGEKFSFTKTGTRMKDMSGLNSLSEAYSRYTNEAANNYPFGRDDH